MQFVPDNGTTAHYVHTSQDIADVWPPIGEYNWFKTGDRNSLVRAFADNAYKGLRAAIRHPPLLRELLGDLCPPGAFPNPCIRNIAPEYPVLWPFGAQSKVQDGPRKVHETRIDGVFHLSPSEESNIGVVLLVEYKTHMELASRSISMPDSNGKRIPADVREKLLQKDEGGSRNMFNGVAGKQTDQHRQAESNSWLLYMNTGLLPSHCVILHTTRRQPPRKQDTRRVAIPGYLTGCLTPLIGTETYNIPCCILAVRRLDMRQEFMRSLLNVMLTGMYRNSGSRNSDNMTSYCDQYYVIPSIHQVLDLTPSKTGDQQLAELDSILPRSVLPAAFALACGACSARWPSASNDKDSKIFGPGCKTPSWVSPVKTGSQRYATNQNQILKLPGTRQFEISKLATIVNSASQRQQEEPGFLLLCSIARSSLSGVSCICRDSSLIVLCKTPGNAEYSEAPLQAISSGLLARDNTIRSVGSRTYPITEPVINTRLRTKLAVDVQTVSAYVQEKLAALIYNKDPFVLYANTVVASTCLCTPFLLQDEDDIMDSVEDTISQIAAIAQESSTDLTEAGTLLRYYTPSGHTIHFAPVVPSKTTANILIVRAIRRILNARLLSIASIAHRISMTDLIDTIAILPAHNALYSPALTLHEFIHNSDCATWSGDLLQMATSLENEQITQLLSNVARDFTIEMSRLMTYSNIKKI
jgi:hypothetical protein